MSKICTSCNTENIDEAKFCRKCGKDNFQKQNTDIDIENSKPIGATKIAKSIENNSIKKLWITFLWACGVWFIFILGYFKLIYEDTENAPIPIFSYCFYGAVNLIGGPFGQVTIASLSASALAYFLPYNDKSKYILVSILFSFLIMFVYGMYLFSGN